MSEGELTGEEIFNDFSQFINEATGVRPGLEPNDESEEDKQPTAGDAADAAASDNAEPDSGPEAADGDFASEAAEEKSEPSDNESPDDDGPEPSDSSEVDWEKRYKDLQSHKDQQLSSMQQQMQEMQMLMAQGMQQPPQGQQGPIRVDPEQLSDAVKNDRVEVFGWAIQQAPHLLPDVIGYINEHHGPVEAEKARTVVQEARLAHIQQSQEAEMAAREAPNMIANGMTQIVEAVSSQDPEAFDELREDTANIIRNTWQEFTEVNGHPPPPDLWYPMVENSFLHAYKQRSLGAQSDDGPKEIAPTPQQHVEMGNARSATPPAPSDNVVDGIMAEFNKAYGN